MYLRSCLFSALALLAAAPAAAAEDYAGTIAFPRSAGEAEFVGVAIVEQDGKCRVQESTGSADSDAFACEVGPQQRRRIDGRVYAMSWQAPAYKGAYVAASHSKAKPKKPPGRAVAAFAEKPGPSLIRKMVIDEAGRIVECSIEGSTGDPSLDAGACDWERERRWVPATLDGVPVAEVRYEVLKLVRRTFLGRPPR